MSFDFTITIWRCPNFTWSDFLILTLWNASIFQLVLQNDHTHEQYEHWATKNVNKTAKIKWNRQTFLTPFPMPHAQVALIHHICNYCKNVSLSEWWQQWNNIPYSRFEWQTDMYARWSERVLPGNRTLNRTVSLSVTSSFRYKIWKIFDVPAPRITAADEISLFKLSETLASICTDSRGVTRNEHRTW